MIFTYIHARMPTTDSAQGTTKALDRVLSESIEQSTRISRSRAASAKGIFVAFYDVLMLTCNSMLHVFRSRNREWSVKKVSFYFTLL